MPSAVVLSSILAQVLTYAFVIIWLHRYGLLGVYRALGWFAAADAARLLISLTIRRGTTVYGWYYLITEVVMWLLLAWLVLEVYGSVFRTHSGLARLSRRVIPGVLAASILFAIGTLAVRGETGSRWPILEAFFLLERTVYISLFAFVACLGVFLAWYPVRLPRNALTHFAVFTGYFACSAAALVLRTIGGREWSVVASLLLAGGSVITGLAWGALLRPAGETIMARAGYSRAPAEEQRLLRQLEDLDRTLLGTQSTRS